MMTSDTPTPPAELPRHVADSFDEFSPDSLRQVATYVEELAEHREREARRAEDDDEDGAEDRPDELPDDVPSKATITVKEINDNRYYYWQWRDGDTIRSQYKGPVTPDG